MATVFSKAALDFALDAKARLDRDGFFRMEGISIGPILGGMEDVGFRRAWSSPLAIDLFICILGDERVKATMVEALGECIFAHTMRYQPYREGTAVSFLRGGPKTDRRGLVVCVWPPRACHKYFRTSHLMKAERTGIRTLWESLSATVENAGCLRDEDTFDKVSVVIQDARTKFEMTDPYVIVLEIVQPQMITPSWVPMLLPKSPEMEKKRDVLDEVSAPIGNLLTFDGTHPLFPHIDASTATGS